MAKVTLNDLSKALGLNEKEPKKDFHYYGTIVSSNPTDRTYEVSINRDQNVSVEAARLVGAAVGDTVMVTVMANGYATVTGRLGGDLDATDAQRAADNAADAASSAMGTANTAMTNATEANRIANNAKTLAENAEAEAGRAKTAADNAVIEAARSASAAEESERQAKRSADAADASEASATQSAQAAANSQASALQSAQSAANSQASATQSAQSAQASATSAANSAASASRSTIYANAALNQLGIVEDVAGTLDWIAKHGTYTRTTDTTIDSEKVYFVYDSSTGDYTPVIDPKAEELSTYYELDITESQGDFIMSHLAVTSRGLWVLPNGMGTASNPQNAPKYKALLAADGMWIYDDHGVMVAKYGDGISFDSTREYRIGDQNTYIRYIDSNNDGIADRIEIKAASISLGSTDLATKISNIEGQISSTDQDLANYITSQEDVIEDLQNQIDGAIDTWYYSGEPAMNKPPVANNPDSTQDWNTDETKENHLRDLYFDTATGHTYRFAKEGNAFKWVQIEDADAIKALADAAAAQGTANVKKRVFVTTPYPPYDIGDLWVGGSQGDIKKCKTSKTSSQSYAAADWELASKYTDDTYAKEVENDLHTNYVTSTTWSTEKDHIYGSVKKLAVRNILRDSATMDLKTWRVGSRATVEDGIATLTGSTADWGAVLETSLFDISYYDGETPYVWSFEYKSTVACSITPVIATSDRITPLTRVRMKYGNWKAAFSLPSTNGEWTKFAFDSRTIALSDLVSGSGDVAAGYLQIYARTNDAVVQIRHMQLEKGEVATAWQPAPEDLYNVSGRNLLIENGNIPSSATFENHRMTNTATDTKTNFNPYLHNFNGETFVSGASLALGAITTPGHYEIPFEALNDSTSHIRVKHNGSKLDIGVIFKLGDSFTKGDKLILSFDLIGANPSVVGGLMVQNMKLEKGAQATAWSLAPEDLDNVTEFMTSFTMTPSELELKAKKVDDGEYLVSQINVQPESVKIASKNVQIDGTATFNAIKSKADAAYDAKGAAAAKKSIHTLDSSYSKTYAQLIAWSKEGYDAGQWAVSSTAGVAVGDTVRIKCSVSDMNNAAVYVLGTVTAVTSATVLRMTSHGLDTTIIDGGNILTNSITANQIKGNTLTLGKLATADQNKILNENVIVGGKNLFGYGSQCESLDGFNVSGEWDITTEDGFKCAHTTGALKTTCYLQTKIRQIPEPNETVTISAYVKIKNIAYGTTNPMCEFYLGGQTLDGAWRSQSLDEVYIDGVKVAMPSTNTLRFTTYITDTNWHHVAFVRTWANYTFTNYQNTSVYLRDATGDLYVRNIKYERGNKATDWTPAPEDVASDIEDASKIATDYLTFTENDGLIVGKTGKKERVNIKSSGLNVYDSSDASVAEFGSTARIGKSNSSRFVTNASSLEAYNSSNQKYFEVSANGITFGTNNTVAKASDIPTNTSQLTNDSNFATTSQLPTKTSQLTNDSNFQNNTQVANTATTAADAAAWSVELETTAIDLLNNTATIKATVYKYGVKQTSGFTRAWYKNGSVISGQTGESISNVTADALYTCVIT